MSLFFQIGPQLSAMYAYAAGVATAAKRAGRPVNADALTDAILQQHGTWDPVVSGRHILADPETRRAAARFLAGVVLAVEA